MGEVSWPHAHHPVDQDGSRYGRGAGLRVLANGKEIAKSDKLQPITGQLP